MGTGQSMECRGKPRITETANFDFRNSSDTTSSSLGEGGSTTTTTNSSQCGGWDSRQNSYEKSENRNSNNVPYWQDTRTQAYWLEDGIDVAKRMEKKEMNIYSSRS